MPETHAILTIDGHDDLNAQVRIETPSDVPPEDVYRLTVEALAALADQRWPTR
jgi:hypothetical protein